MEGVYQSSWKLYKAHTESFFDDIEYYSCFVRDHSALELFAGYGRVTNQLLKFGHCIDTVEIQQEFADFIDLPVKQNHVCDVLSFTTHAQFSRIFSAYNSFCLLVNEVDIYKFFALLSSWLQPQGQISLNYYHPDFWKDAVSSEFNFEGDDVKYMPSYDLSKRKDKRIGEWIDQYQIHEEIITHKYITRIYESEHDLEPFLKGTGLYVSHTIENFGKRNITEPGWIDFILKKY